MESQIEELNLLLIYLNGWEEDNKKKSAPMVFTSWKWYPYDVLDHLKEKGYILHHRDRSQIFFTEKGKQTANKLKSKYIHGNQ